MSNLQKVKCVLVGDGTVGKTCMLAQYIEEKFEEEYIPTVMDTYYELLTVDGKIFNLELWDTAGQEGYDRLRSISYNETDVFLLCFSLISLTSLANVRSRWYPELRHYRPHTPVILVGNKSDLKEAAIASKHDDEKKKVVPHEDCLAMRREIQAHNYIECSALTGYNLRLLFEEACRVAVKYSLTSNIKKKRCLIL